MVVTTSKEEARRVIKLLIDGSTAPPVLSHENVATSDPDSWCLRTNEVYLAHTAEMQSPQGQPFGTGNPWERSRS